MEPKLKTYVFTIRWRENPMDNWQFSNYVVSSVDVKSAIKSARDFALSGKTVKTTFVIDNIYSEEAF